MDSFHSNREKAAEFIPLDQKVDFYFDNQTKEKAAILAGWDNYIKERPDHTRNYYGATPRFEDDQDFLPLQAADFWAWWVRKWYSEGNPEKQERLDFGLWQEKRRYLRIDIAFPEDQIVKDLIPLVKRLIKPGLPIFDVSFHLTPGGWTCKVNCEP